MEPKRTFLRKNITKNARNITSVNRLVPKKTFKFQQSKSLSYLQAAAGFSSNQKLQTAHETCMKRYCELTLYTQFAYLRSENVNSGKNNTNSYRKFI